MRAVTDGIDVLHAGCGSRGPAQQHTLHQPHPTGVPELLDCTAVGVGLQHLRSE